MAETLKIKGHIKLKRVTLGGLDQLSRDTDSIAILKDFNFIDYL